MKYEFITGSYGNTEEEGIERFELDTRLGTLTKLSGFKGIFNPSFVALSPDRKLLYAVEERSPDGFIHTLHWDETGLSHLTSHATRGADPCYIGMDANGGMLLVANYTSGSLAVYQTDENGIPKEMTDFVEHEGKGPHPVRQEGPHAHYCRMRGNEAFVVDLGLDKAFIYEIDKNTGKVTDSGKYLEFPKGSGPRHLEFDPERPELVYAVCELESKAAVFQEENGRYKLKQILSTLPDDFSETNIAAAIRYKNGHLFISNRGHDSIAMFKAGEDGLLTLTDITKTGGRTPRDFNIMGDYLVAANQDSDLLTVLKINWAEGKMEQTGISAEHVRPTCVEIV